LPDITYSVLINISIQDSGGMDGVFRKLDGMHSRVDRLSLVSLRMFQQMNEGFQRIVEHAARFAEHMAMAGAIAGVGALTWAVFKLDNQFERMRIGMAGEMLSEGVVGDMPRALSVSNVLMEKLRADSAQLPVEFRELAQVFQMSLIPGLQAGASVGAIERISTLSATLGAATGLGMHQVGTGLSQLFAGVVRTTNPLARLLGITSEDARKQFKDMMPSDRIDFISQKLERWGPTIKEFANSFIGLFTTLKTNIMTATEMATKPLFERVKSTLREANGWFLTHGGVVQDWAEKVGVRLGRAFDWVKEKILEWGPVIMQFMRDAYDRIKDLASGFSPIFDGLKSAMQNGDLINKLETVAKLYAVSKVAEGIASAATPLMYGAGAAGMMGSGGGIFAGMAESAPALAAGLPVLAAGAVTVGGTMMAAADDTSKYQKEAANNMSQWGVTINQFKDSLDGLGDAFKAAGTKLGSGLLWLGNQATAIGDWAIPGNASVGMHHRYWEEDTYQRVATFRHNRSSTTDDPSKLLAKAISGTGQTNIGPVYFAISGNQEPSRIARVVAAHLAEMGRHRTTSPSVPNFSSKRSGSL
jgi:hypothetical protein